MYWNTTNNWENLEDFEDVANMSSIDALDPKVYYSVVWTDRAWVITYGFYHPRDWSLHTGLCCDNPTIGLPWIPETGDNHENDFEGVILFVSRISTSNGIEPFEVFGAASIAHSELKTYSISNLPEVFVDNRSHAVELNLEGLDCIDYDSAANCDNCKYFFATDHIVYSPVDQDQEPFVTSDDNNDDDYLSGFGNYELEDIFENSSESLWSQRDNTDVFVGDIFAREDGTDCTEYGGDASAPWGWSQFKWQGITAFDNNMLFSGGTLNINNSFIEDAIKGVALGNSFSFDSTNSNLNKTTFKRCDTGIVYKFGPTNSILDECTFFGNAVDVNMQTSWGLKIKNSVFIGDNSEVNNTNIQAMNSRYSIDDYSVVRNGSLGITNYATIPLMGSVKIGSMDSPSNLFKNNLIDIISAGVNYQDGITIENNNFENGLYNCYAAGDNKYDITNNTFGYGTKGVYSDATGAEFNFARCNEASGSTIYMTGINENTTILGNDFTVDPGTWDNIELDDAKIISMVGETDNPAGNCFTDNGEDIVLVNGSSSFTYIANSKVDCHVPDAPIDYLLQQTLSDDDNCFEVGSYNLIDPDGDGELGVVGIGSELYDSIDYIALEDSIRQWINTLTGTGGDDYNTYIDEGEGQNTTESYYAEQVLLQWIDFAIVAAMQGDQIEYIEDVLLPIKDSMDLNYIKEIALSDQPTKGYALSFYKQLTNENLILEDISRNSTFGRNANSISSGYVNKTFFPNPTKGIIHFEIGQVELVSVYSITGVLLAQDFNVDQIDLSHLNNGLYVIVVEYQGKVSSEKVLKQ